MRAAGSPGATGIEEVVRLDEALRQALELRDLETVERLFAPEFTLQSPANAVVSRQEVIDLLSSSPARHTDVERTIEAAYASGDVVVLMGYESLTWEGTGTGLDGHRTARRFTNVWRYGTAGWQHIARQATTVPLLD